MKTTTASDVCTCPNCGHQEPHTEKGVPCDNFDCPNCGSPMQGENCLGLAQALIKAGHEDLAKELIQSAAKRLPYNASLYIQEETDEFVVYLASGGSKLPEWAKSFEDQKSAIKFFTNCLKKIAKDMEPL